MRHAVFGRKLGRDINARKALLFNLTSALFERGFIVTTQTKAKFAKSNIEKLITQAQRKNDIAKMRTVASQISKKAFAKLTADIAPSFSNRQGGYTKIIKLNTRRGDSAQMARLELVKVPKQNQQEKSKSENSTEEEQKNTKSKKAK